MPTGGAAGGGGKDWIRGLAERAKAKPGGGFTINPATGSEQTSGYAVGQELEGQATPADEFDASHIEKFMEEHPDSMLGGWHDPESGHIFLDPVNVISNRAEAEALGAERNQIAIGDLAKYAAGQDGEIKIGGTGGLK